MILNSHSANPIASTANTSDQSLTDSSDKNRQSNTIAEPEPIREKPPTLHSSSRIKLGSSQRFQPLKESSRSKSHRAHNPKPQPTYHRLKESHGDPEVVKPAS